MPGVPPEDGKVVPMGAICAPPPAQPSGSSNIVLPERRANENIYKSMLRASMVASGTEGTFEMLPMDDEKRKFLEEALTSMTINVVEILRDQMQILLKVDTVGEDDDASEYLNAIDTILEYVDNIDVANDFKKIGGLELVKPCLRCKNAAVRARACTLVAELCQNNLECQTAAINGNIFRILLSLLTEDKDVEVGVKSLYAISALVRDNVLGFTFLQTYGGFDILIKTLQRDDDRFRIKAAFLLCYLCRTYGDVKGRLNHMETVPTLLLLVSGERRPSTEHILDLLVMLVEDSPTALNECKKPIYNFKEVLTTYISNVQNKEEFREEEEYCKQLLHRIFT